MSLSLQPSLKAGFLAAGTVFVFAAIAEPAYSCGTSSVEEIPASSRKVIEIPEWRVSFSIPENYELFRNGSVVEVLSPSSYAQTQCRFTPRPAHNIEPYGVSVALLNRTVTEADIRAQIAPGTGTYLGPTGMPSGIAYMHETYAENDLVHLSLPVPGQAATIVFTANTDSFGEIHQEEVLETILDSFVFEP